MSSNGSDQAAGQAGSETDAGSGPIAVAGATGFVGSHVVAALLGRGHAVRALVRDASKAVKILGSHEHLEIRTVTSLSPAGLGTKSRRLDPHSGRLRMDGPTTDANPLEGCSACVNCVGIIREVPGGQTFDRVHVQVVEALLQACEHAGGGRFVQISATGVGPEGPTEYQTSKYEAEVMIRASGMDWTILRPGLIHGVGSEFIEMASAWSRAKAVPFVMLPYFTRFAEGKVLTTEAAQMEPVHVEDVAGAVASSIERDGSIGEVYLLTGPERLDWPTMLQTIRDAVPGGKPWMPTVGVPGKIAAMKAKGAAIIGLRDALPFDEGMALMGSEDSVADPTKAREHLGFEPRAFSASLATYSETV